VKTSNKDSILQKSCFYKIELARVLVKNRI